MSTYSNITGGLNIPAQIPLDTKAYAQNEDALADLGLNNNKAFSYFDRLKVFCKDEKTVWEWREVLVGEENTGLVDQDFTYPSDIVVDGVTYSNKKYNFYEVKVITEDNIGDYLTVGPPGPPGAPSTIPGPPGIQGPPGVDAVNNLQKLVSPDIDGVYTVIPSDNNHTILVDSSVATTIRIPVGLPDRMNVGFIQVGSSDVTFLGVGVTVNSPLGMTKIKGINYWAYLEKVGSTNVFQLLGTLKA
jgi:hypothetical protein